MAQQATSGEWVEQADLDRDFSLVQQRIGQYALQHGYQPTYHEADAASDILNYMGRFPILEASEEVILAKVIERGRELHDLTAPEEVLAARQAQAAKSLFMQCNIKLAISIAKKYGWSEVPLIDRIQVGTLGIERAIEKFDWRKGYKFSTYATWWIRQFIGKELERSEYLVRLPTHVRDNIRQIERARREFVINHGDEPSQAILAEVTGFSAQTVEQLLAAQRQVSSIQSVDAPIGEDQTATLGQIIRLNDLNEIDLAITDLANKQAVRQAMEGLNDREKKVIDMRYFDGANFGCIAQELGLQESSVRVIERNAIRKMRRLIKPERGEASYG